MPILTRNIPEITGKHEPDNAHTQLQNDTMLCTLYSTTGLFSQRKMGVEFPDERYKSIRRHYLEILQDGFRPEVSQDNAYVYSGRLITKDG